MRGQIVVERFASEALKGNALGDPAERDLYLYLPPSYAPENKRRYPVVYCLAGFTGRGQTLLNAQPFAPNLAERLDAMIAAGTSGEMILVMPDCLTRLGGSQYLNSTATGRYEDYLVREIVPFVDARYRTVAEPAGRALAGKSSGGYAALVHAMRHPNVFGLAASHSGDCYFEYCYATDFPQTVRALKGDPAEFIERFWREEKKNRSDVPALNILAMSACYSPDPAAPLGFALPFDLTTGRIDEQVWARWLEHDPVRLADKYADNLRTLKLLYLDAGTRDEYGLDLGARVLCSRLSAAGVPFVHEEFDDGHFNTSYRYARSLALISKAIRRDRHD